jgi:hypothetical protein
MPQDALTDIARDLKNLANDLDFENRGQVYFVAPSRQVAQLREIAVDLCFLSSLEWSFQNGEQIIERLRRHGEALEAIARSLVQTPYEVQLRRIVFDLINETPEIMKAIVRSMSLAVEASR